MSENEESVKVEQSRGDGVPIYRVALVRESTVIESTVARRYGSRQKRPKSYVRYSPSSIVNSSWS